MVRVLGGRNGKRQKTHTETERLKAGKKNITYRRYNVTWKDDTGDQGMTIKTKKIAAKCPLLHVADNAEKNRGKGLRLTSGPGGLSLTRGKHWERR